MAVNTYKVADIVGDHLVPYGRGKFSARALAAFLLKFTPNFRPDDSWILDVILGEGQRAAFRVSIDLPCLISSDIKTSSRPMLFLQDSQTGQCLIYFRNRLFMVERLPLEEPEFDEISLRIRKAVFDEEAELSNLRATVANWESAADFQKSGPKRDPIPEDVKLLVWARDGGHCARCGSTQDLHFDHIIPVAKGGGNSGANIQILCQSCNLRKADKIAIT